MVSVLVTMSVLNLVSYVIVNIANPVSKPRFNLHCAGFPKMRQIISDVDWENILNPLDPHDAWHYFSTVFDDIQLLSIIGRQKQQAKCWYNRSKSSKIHLISCSSSTSNKL